MSEEGHHRHHGKPRVVEPYSKHVFICTSKSCTSGGSQAVLEKFSSELEGRKLTGQIKYNTCSSIDLCDYGPNIVIYPDGVWYSGVTPDDVVEIIDEHLLNGRIVTRLLTYKASF